ncbi:hypothetical protein H0Z60_10095 [Ectothiorhodospiraceae bacterium WFHF3C12]|nr:hypothetical protein [Ectothiorhodospiraceae bacterium WFHF3C12]
MTVFLQLPAEEAEALAQLVKRQTFDDYLDRAADEDEAYRMRGASFKLRRALAEAGFAPR